MRTDLFDFDLPADRIALRPVSPRDAARLLVVRPGEAAELEDRTIADLPDLLRAGDCLVVNDSKVIAARLSRPADRARLDRARDRGHAAQADRRLALARFRKAGQEAAGGRYICGSAARARSVSSANSMLKFHIKMREAR